MILAIFYVVPLNTLHFSSLVIFLKKLIIGGLQNFLPLEESSVFINGEINHFCLEMDSELMFADELGLENSQSQSCFVM